MFVTYNIGMMRIVSDTGEVLVQSERLREIILRVVRMAEIVEHSPKGRIEISYAGRSVKHSLTLFEV